MTQSRLGRLNISTIKRTARKRGPLSSDVWNDSFDEVIADLTNLYNEWNNYLHPFMAAVPDGTDDTDVDAFTTGLDGSTLYADSLATDITNATYYSVSDTRPYTVLEIFEDLYTQIDTLETTLSAQIGGVTFSATNVSITDTAGYFTATNVEDALAELAVDLDTIIDGAYVPTSGGTMTGNLNLAAYRVIFGTAFISAGSGTPEGSLAAPVGSLYLDLSGSTGTTLYVKETGTTTSSGWAAK